ncbi:MAG: hypothetical protein KDK78_02975, partial [Chlamydiia bacterium]|nr:hypothetical protein [Chlamydiia bacterium]
FQLLTESRQTGFPHPSQYCAWGLGESLLPSCPLRPSDLPIASALLERKQEIAQGLLPGGSLLPRAKRWLDARRSALEQHATDFLRLNQRLALVLLGSSAEVADYFESLSHQDKALLSLSRCWQAFDTQYSERLREEMRRTFTPGIDLEEAAEIARTLHDKLLKKLEKKASKAEHGHEARFLCFVAAQLGGPIQEIFLQRASEKFRFMPPELSDRAQRLQAAAWRALESFAEDMDVLEGSDDTPSTSLQADEISYLLQRDIALFSLPLEQLQRAQGMDIVHELKAYYGRRYQGA